MADELKHLTVGTALSQAEYEAVGGHVFACQAKGDILYASSTTQLSRIGKGAQNTLFSMGASCTPAWTACPSITNLTVSTNLLIKDQGDLRLEESGGGCSYVAIQAPACLSANYTITLPTAVAGTCGFVLTSTTGGVTSWAAAGGGALTLIGTATASCDTTVTVTGLDSTYCTYLISLSDIHSQNNGTDINLRLGDSTAIKSAACDYRYRTSRSRDDDTDFFANVSAGAAQIMLIADDGNDSGEAGAVEVWLHTSHTDGSGVPMITGTVIAVDGGGRSTGGVVHGRLAKDGVSVACAVDVTQVQILPGCGNIVSGRLTVWGLTNA